MHPRPSLFFCFLLFLALIVPPIQADICTSTLIVNSETVSVPAGEPAFVDLLANDSQDCGAPLAVIVAPQSCPGTVQDYGDGSITYFPAGQDEACTISYRVTSEDGGSATTTVQVVVGMGTTNPGGSSVPLLRLDELVDPHRFISGGSSVYLAGYYPGIQALLVAEAGVGLRNQHEELFDALVANRVNLLRAVLTMGMALETHDWLHPYNRSNDPSDPNTYHSSQEGITGGRVFDLSSFNEGFFNYWNLVVEAAETRGLYLQVAILDGFHVHEFDKTDSRGDAVAPLERFGRIFDYLRPTNRSNSVATQLSTERDFYQHRVTVETQEKFVERAVGDLCHHDGIVWELINEPNDVLANEVLTNWRDPGKTWIQIIYEAVRRAEAEAGCSEHLVMPFHSPDHRDLAGHWTPSGGERPDDPLPGDDPGRDDEDLEYQVVYQALVGDFEAVYTIPEYVSGAGGGANPNHLPLIADNDCCATPGTPLQLRKKAWLSLLAGANPSMLVYDVPGRTIGAPEIQDGMRWVGYTRQLVLDRGINLVGMVPRSDLIHQNAQDMVWLSARAGEEYIAYLFNGGTVSFIDGVLPESYQAWWFDPRSGTEEAIQPVPANGVFTKPAGSNSDWVLYLRGADGGGTSITITSQPQSLTVEVGKTALFAAGAAANPPQPLTFVWTLDGGPISVLGVRATVTSTDTTSQLTISDLQLSDAGSIRCRASGGGAAVDSDDVTLTVVEVLETESTVGDHFELGTAGPVSGDPLAGAVTDLGFRTWQANIESVFGGNGASGYVTHIASQTTIQGAGGVAFDPDLMVGQPQVLTVAADFSVTTGSGWGAIGFGSTPFSSFWVDGVWVLLQSNGDWTVYDAGHAGGALVQSSAPVEGFLASGENALKLQYDRLAGTLSAWVNEVPLILNQPLQTSVVPDTRFVGFRIFATNGGAEGRIRLDDFWAMAGGDPGELDDAAIVVQSFPPAMGCGSTDMAAVTVQNLGNTAWNGLPIGRGGGYLWDVPDTDPFTLIPVQVRLDEGETIFPLETKTFIWDLTAPATPSPPQGYRTQGRMLRESFGGFGSTAFADITVDCDNLPPEPVDDPRTVEMNGTFRFTGASLITNDTDPNGDALFFVELDTAGTAGTVDPVIGAPIPTFDYHAPPGVSGTTDTVRYLVEDEQGAGAWGNLVFTIPLNHRPVPVPDTLSTPANISVTFTADFLTGNDTDQDGDGIELSSLTLTGVTAGLDPLPGVTPTTYEFVPPTGGIPGDFIFNYFIQDEHGLAASFAGTLTITVVQQPPVPAEDRMLVPFGTAFFRIPEDYLLANDTDPNGDPLSVTSLGDPAFGSFGFSQFGQGYVADPEFWNVGSDAFTYQVTDGFNPSQGLVRLEAEPVCDIYFGDGAESGDLSTWDSIISFGGGSISADAAAAFQGSYGIRIAPAQGTTQLYVQDDLPVEERHFRAGFRLNPNDFVLTAGGRHNLFTGFTPGQNAFMLQMVAGTSEPQLSLVVSEDNNVQLTAPAVELGSEFWQIWHRVFVDWWAASAPGANDGGARLWIDGQLAAEILGADNDGRMVGSLRLGAVWGIDPGFSGTYFIDSYTSCDGPRSSRTLKADDFESGTLAAWDELRQTGTGSVSAAASAALAGSFGLEVALGTGASELYILDESLAAQRHLWVEFSVDTSALRLSSGSVSLLEVEGGGPGNAAQLSLVFAGNGGFLDLDATQDDGLPTFGGNPIDLPAGEHHIRVEVGSAASPGEASGFVHLWLDGQPMTGLEALRNSTQAAERIRLGAVSSIPASASGFLYFDDYRSWSAAEDLPVLADDFEAGSTAAWDVVMASGGGTVNVTGAAALGGTQGLAIGLVEGAGQVHVRKDLAHHPASLTAEFRFDPNSIAMNNGSAHPIFQAGAASGGAMALSLAREFGLYQLRIQGIHDGGQSVLSSLTALTDEPHTLRLEFHKATAPGLSDGSLDLWVDGTKVLGLTGLDNATKAPSTLRLGAVWLLDPGTVGTLYFDDFRAW